MTGASSPRVTIRKSTVEERRDKYPPIVAGGPRIRVPKYVAVEPTSDRIWTVFGIPQGGDTRAEAVFWATRLSGKNGVDYVPPHGWENVEGVLPV